MSSPPASSTTRRRSEKHWKDPAEVAGSPANASATALQSGWNVDAERVEEALRAAAEAGRRLRQARPSAPLALTGTSATVEPLGSTAVVAQMGPALVATRGLTKRPPGLSGWSKSAPERFRRSGAGR
jgi:hypothetical protein